MSSLILLAQAIGIAYAAGLNLYATVGFVGLAERLGWLAPLPGTLSSFANPWVISIALLLYLIEFNIRYDTGFELGLIAFTAAVLGGIGNLSGAVLGALIIGLIQAFNEGLSWAAPGSDWTRSIVFGLLIGILVFRPEGLLGERTPEGV